MGLDRNTKTPCGFCFVIYHTRAHALAAVRYLNGTKLDNRQLRVDIDPGFEEGRQFGRGRSGGQVSTADHGTLSAGLHRRPGGVQWWCTKPRGRAQGVGRQFACATALVVKAHMHRSLCLQEPR